MLARNVTLEQLEQAAQEVGVRLYGPLVERQTRRGPEYRFTLKTGDRGEQRIDWRGKLRYAPRFQRLSQHTRRSTAAATPGQLYNPVVPGAVCFHGHEAFFRALYRLAPTAWIKTSKAIYTSARQFEATFRAAGAIAHTSGWDGGGYRGQQLPYEQACSCREGGVA